MKTDYKWLDPWSSNLKGKEVLELGCGSGIDTDAIAKYTKTIVACDLEPPQKKVKGISIMQVDHSEVLPFEDNKYDVVVASLCLHYFSWSVTEAIIGEISRVLKPQGLLMCRLNSNKDFNYGAVGHPQLESGLYSVEGRSKRFFSLTDIEMLFPLQWKVMRLEEKSIDRYDKEKFIWEFGAQSAD